MVFLAVAQDGCSSDQKVCTVADSSPGCYVDCPQTIDEYCATQICLQTWNDVLSDPGLCPVIDPVIGSSSSVGDCGPYHLLASGGEFGGSWNYYDIATGKLVASTYVAHDQLVHCGGAPTRRFTPPDCTGAALHLPPLCSVDGGTDGP
jgi:hypothetical protein